MGARGRNDKNVALAARNADAARLAELLAGGASPDSDDHGEDGKDPRSALAWAIKRSDANCVEMLLGAGADPELCVGESDPPLIAAAIRASAKIISLLVSAGANPNRKGAKGTAALAWAAHFKHIDATRLLLEKGAEVDARNDRGETPAMMALFTNSWETLALLIEAGADPSARSAEGFTGLDYANGNDGGGRLGPECIALMEAAELAAVVKKSVAPAPAPRL